MVPSLNVATGTAGGGLTKFFNIQNKKFTTISCTKCTYTEIYKTDTSALSNVLDFLGS
jgi:predicted nucleic-acid-binding Zn-ribbon protein